MEIAEDGIEQPHTVHFYDVGIGGDGLRGPQEGLINPQQKFPEQNHKLRHKK